MIKLRYQNYLLFCSLDLNINSQNLNLKNVLIDTGSATTLINADYILLDGNEKIKNAQGIGGYERILVKKFESLRLNDITLKNVSLSIGDMDYGIDIDLLIGLDMLKILNANINIKNMTLELNGCNVINDFSK
ncbi:retroviral-like aspartic protease family protein [Clostridium sp.]|uniref:retroviral-like aspartic protease family protein n=1 Tax=Clostridium sp. TaxID=1506 RepID=UPI0026067D72|nr:retroviral-like aspartic protease family protein [Clostridium sp.]